MFDHYGLMWIGTDQGLRSFDGYSFKTYRSDAYSPGLLPNNYVQAIAEAGDDQLWIGTRDGLVCYHRRRGVFKTYHLQGEQARTIHTLFTTADGTVWVGTNAGASYYDAKKDDFIDIKIPPGIRSFAEDKNGNLYLGTWEGGLMRLDRKNGILKTYPPMNERNTVQSMLIDSRGRLWIGTWEHGIIRLDHPENDKDPLMHHINEGRLDFRTFHHLVEDSVSHSIWGCCIEGLTRVDIDDVTQVENYDMLKFCYDIQSDGAGNLWVCTRNNGIVHLSTKPSPFRFSHLNPAGLELPVNRIQTIFTADGSRFWLGLQPYGLALYDRRTDHVSYNSHIPGMGQLTGLGGLYVQTISDMMERPDGELWMASSRGILIWKEAEPARQLLRGTVPFLADTDVHTFLGLSGNAQVLVGMGSGVGVALSESEGYLLSLQENGRDFSSCNVLAMMEDSRRRIWIATEDRGLIRITGDVSRPGGYTCHQYAPANQNYPIDEAADCYEDAEHRLWAVSSSGGLFLFNEEKDAFEPVNHRFHIGMGSIYAIEGDAHGWLWLSTDKGLMRLKAEGERNIAAFYNLEDGIENTRFSPNGSFQYGKELFFGSADGFFSFTPETLVNRQPSTSPTLAVTELLIDDRPYAWRDSVQRSRISESQPFFTRHITIPADVQKFSVEFSLLAYQNQEQCRYAYRLEGYDRNWNYTDAENRKATYQNLPAGCYELHLRAVDSYSNLSDMPYTIEIRVLPPWYRSWWAYLIYLCLLAVAVYGIMEWYRLRVNRQARLQQRVNELLHYRELMVMKQFEGARKALEVEEKQHSSPDELFIQKAIDCVKQHLDDADYDREQFASDMCVSSSTLYNKLRALTGQNVTGFINGIRLKEACSILRQNPSISIGELSMQVGFNTPKYFTKLFKKEFDMLPSEYAKSAI